MAKHMASLKTAKSEMMRAMTSEGFVVESVKAKWLGVGAKDRRGVHFRVADVEAKLVSGHKMLGVFTAEATGKWDLRVRASSR